MITPLKFDADLIRRYDLSGPRYTSYPTAVHFTDSYRNESFQASAYRSNEDPIPRPLSLYFHIPFCSTLCFYCACNKVVTKDRSKADQYLQRLYKEIQLQAKLFDHDREVHQIHLGGGTPTFLNMGQMQRLLDFLADHFNLCRDDGRDFSIEIDPRTIEPETLFQLRDLGFNRVSLGVQDFDPNVQIAVHRIQPKDQTLEIIEAAKQAGFKSINLDLMYGLPKQSLASFEETIYQVIGANPGRLCLFNYAHLPQLFMPQQRIKEEDLPSPEDKLKMLETSIQRLTEAGYLYIGMDHFAKVDDDLAISQSDGTLYRNFQGYATHADCDLIGMGVSSISQIADTYSQNARTLDQYYARIDKGELSIYRGVELTKDDLLRRDIISQLMCYGSIQIPDIEIQHSIQFNDYFSDTIPHIQNLASDGLIEYKTGRIEVTPEGRLLVRNICMAFDRYLQNAAITTNYSKVI